MYIYTCILQSLFFCSLWEGPMLEMFIEEHLWEGPQGGSGEERDESPP